MLIHEYTNDANHCAMISIFATLAHLRISINIRNIRIIYIIQQNRQPRKAARCEVSNYNYFIN